MHRLGILKAEMIFLDPAGIMGIKGELFVINNCTSQHFTLVNNYLDSSGININNHPNRYFTIGENKRQKFAFPLEKNEITVIREVRNLKQEKLVEAFAYYNELLADIKGHEVETMLNMEIPYPPPLTRPAYPDSPLARESLECHINELIKLGFLRKDGHNEEVEVTTPVIITWHNHKSWMVGDFTELDTYTIPDMYPIPIIHETFTNYSKKDSSLL
ncbi:hypothetical protein O181_062280 [Austropuccinia psidii MF-1]|uniref:Uncharacterized protein n=1 Tax=Austropuccinia psidii MF-1 TaxID=1389203 RepID=A0A9Q3I177_9BASI|nr:hypothetical protein [Austropuccinia psidii MF-1]